MKKIILTLFIVMLLATSPLFSAELNQYAAGDQIFSFHAGIQFPAFTYLPYYTEPDMKFLSFFDTGFSLFGIGSLDYMYFTSPKLSLGGEIGYGFSSSRSSNTFSCIPLLAKLALYPVQNGKFDLIFDFGVGISFLKYTEQASNYNGFYVAPTISIGINPVFYVSSNWGIGISADIVGFTEIYFNEKKSHTSITAIAPVRLTCSYRH